MRILLVEDDEMLAEGLRIGLIQNLYTVDWVKNGQAALQCLLTENFDAVILDLALPRLSGAEVLKTIRKKGKQIPVLILTAKDQTVDRVTGLDMGADDYLVKPFQLEEICARLRALMRRYSGRASPSITYDYKNKLIVLDPAAHTVSLNGTLTELSRREHDLLQMLIENQGKVLSRETMTQCLYGWSNSVDSNALEVHIHNLRKRFGNDFIKTVRGIGYVVEKPL